MALEYRAVYLKQFLRLFVKNEKYQLFELENWVEINDAFLQAASDNDAIQKKREKSCVLT